MVSKQKKQPGIYENAKTPFPMKVTTTKVEEDDEEDDDWDNIYFDNTDGQENDG
jgi:hypothetical protein